MEQIEDSMKNLKEEIKDSTNEIENNIQNIPSEIKKGEFSTDNFLFFFNLEVSKETICGLTQNISVKIIGIISLICSISYFLSTFSGEFFFDGLYELLLCILCLIIAFYSFYSALNENSDYAKIAYFASVILFFIFFIESFLLSKRSLINLKISGILPKLLKWTVFWDKFSKLNLFSYKEGLAFKSSWISDILNNIFFSNKIKCISILKLFNALLYWQCSISFSSSFSLHINFSFTYF